MASSDGIGYLDTNIVIHSLTSDEHSAECLAFLHALERGDVFAELDVLVLHELTYMGPRYRKQYARADVTRLLIWLVGLEGIKCDRDLLTETLKRWASSDALGFVDAHLLELAKRLDRPIYTKNAKHFVGQGVPIPDPLPSIMRR